MSGLASVYLPKSRYCIYAFLVILLLLCGEGVRNRTEISALEPVRCSSPTSIFFSFASMFLLAGFHFLVCVFPLSCQTNTSLSLPVTLLTSFASCCSNLFVC